MYDWTKNPEHRNCGASVCDASSNKTRMFSDFLHGMYDVLPELEKIEIKIKSLTDCKQCLYEK